MCGVVLAALGYTASKRTAQELGVVKVQERKKAIIENYTQAVGAVAGREVATAECVVGGA